MGRTPYLGIMGMESKNDFRLAEEAMEFTDVVHLADRKIYQLSGGELQRVIIARAICQQPDIILLDEPTSELDRDAEVRLVMALRQLAKVKTIVVVTHSPLLLAHCQGLLVMNKGKLMAGGPAEQILPKLGIQPAGAMAKPSSDNATGKQAA